MTRAGLIVMMALAVGAGAARAQNPPAAPPTQPEPDSLRYLPPGMNPGMDPERTRMLREQVDERFGRMVKERLQLNDQQSQQLRTAMRANQDRRRNYMRRQMDLRRGIMGQMQPGVAANNDSLNRMLQEQGRLRVEMAQSDEQFQRDLSFLTPVQRAQLMMMQQNFEERVRDIARRRMDQNGGRDGMRGGPRDGNGMDRQRPENRDQRQPSPPQEV